MSDIIVTLPKSRGGITHLNEKLEAVYYAEMGQDIIAYWEFSRMPKKLDMKSKIYVVCEGYLRGYFTISDIEETRVILVSWNYVEQVEMVGFQGYRYYQGSDKNEME